MVADAIETVVRFLWRMVLEIFVALFVEGPGRMLIRIFRPAAVPGDRTCQFFGMLFWLVMVIAAVVVYRYATT